MSFWSKLWQIVKSGDFRTALFLAFDIVEQVTKVEADFPGSGNGVNKAEAILNYVMENLTRFDYIKDRTNIINVAKLAIEMAVMLAKMLGKI